LRGARAAQELAANRTRGEALAAEDASSLPASSGEGAAAGSSGHVEWCRSSTSGSGGSSGSGSESESGGAGEEDEQALPRCPLRAARRARRPPARAACCRALPLGVTAGTRPAQESESYTRTESTPTSTSY